MKLRPRPMFYILIMGILVWTLVFTVGFFTTIIWLVIVSALIGLYMRLSGRA